MEAKLKQHLPDGKFTDVSASRSKTMGAIKGKNNKTTELKLKMAIIRAGISGWKLNYKEVLGKPDFYFPAHKVALFVDGCFWHGCPKCGHIPKTRSKFWKAKIENNQRRDKNTIKKLKELGIVSMRIWEHELAEKESRDQIIRKIKLLVRNDHKGQN